MNVKIEALIYFGCIQLIAVQSVYCLIIDGEILSCMFFLMAHIREHFFDTMIAFSLLTGDPS